MQSIPEEVIQEVRKKIDIVDVINQYVQLTKKGNSYTASCPFHEDNNPSFSVHSQKQIFKCFSCGRGGNIFGFLQEIEGISFPEAVFKAAEMVNVPMDAYLQSANKKPQDQTEQFLYQIHTKVSDFYQYYLNSTVNGEDAYNYLQQRNLLAETIDSFGIGLAPENSDLVLQYLFQEDFTQDQLEKSGIFYLNEHTGKLVDRFRGRIIFPLRNQQGQVVGFSGRQFVENQQASNAKYLNSPETSIFQKNRLLFNLDKARLPIRQLNQVLICEGFMDVIALNQAGFEHAVATMGTSLTEQHLQYLSKLSKELVFVFDGDNAGQKATNRAFEMSSKFTQNIFKNITIPRQLDPDDWIRQHGADSFQNLINHASTQYEFQVKYLEKDYDLNNQQELAQYIEVLIQLIAQIPSPIEQQLRLNNLIQSYQLSESLIKEQFAQQRRIFNKNQQSNQSNTYQEVDIQEYTNPATTFEIKSQRAYQCEKTLLANLIYYEKAWDFVEQLDDALILFHEQAQSLYFQLQYFYYDLGYPIPLTDIVGQIQDSQLNHYLTTLIWEKDPLNYSDQIMIDCLQVIKEEFVKLEIQELTNKLGNFRLEQNEADANALVIRILQLTRQLKSKNSKETL